MATRSRAAQLGFIDWLFGRGRKRQREARAERREAASERAPATTEVKPEEPKPEEPKPDEEETPPTMRKGIYISALIYIEGEQAPAENFATHAKAALRSALEKALDGEHDGLTMTLKELEVRNDVEEEDEGDKAAPKEKFEF